MSEKRKEHRLRANMPITIVWGKEKALRGRTENISRLGSFVELDKQIPAGQIVGIILELPAYTQDISLTGRVTCSGTVFRSIPLREIDGVPVYGLGIFFTDFANSSDKDKISAYVDHLLAAEEQGIKDGLKRRKEKASAHLGAAEKKNLIARQDEFQKEALGLLQQISSRLDAIERKLNSKKK